MNLSDEQLADRLFASGRAELTDDDGVSVSLVRRWSAREWVRVSAPRMMLEPGLTLTGQMETEPGVPWLLTFEVDSVRQTGPAVDEAELRITSSSIYPERRKAQRAQVGGALTITAHYASELISQRQFRGEFDIVSETGCAISSAEPFSLGEHLTLSGRLLLVGRIEADVVIRCSRPGDSGRATIYGCEWDRLDAPAQETLRRVVATSLAETPTESR
jgi:hypothetical protein